MKKLICGSLLVILMLVGNSCCANDLIRLRYPPEVVWLQTPQPVIVQPEPVAWTCCSVPTVVYQPVVVQQPVWVPVVQPRVHCCWPNYGHYYNSRPTYIRY